jgi:hypothetical protein
MAMGVEDLIFVFEFEAFALFQSQEYVHDCDLIVKLCFVSDLSLHCVDELLLFFCDYFHFAESRNFIYRVVSYDVEELTDFGYLKGVRFEKSF